MWKFLFDIVLQPVRMTIRRRKYVGGFVAVICLSGGMVLAQNDRPHYSIENPKYNSLTVASVGNHIITAQEFLLNYEFGPAFPKREKDSKKQYLNFMIYEKLLALDGYRRKIDTTEDARLSLSEMEGDLATEELYKRDILTKVKVSENAIQSGIAQEHIHYSVQWIYEPTEDHIVRQIDLLHAGISFDSLFKIQLTDSVKLEDRSMDITRFRIGIKNPILASVLDTLHPYSVSKPVHAPDGYYLFFVSDVQHDPIVTQSERMKMHEDVKQALIQHIADSLSDIYIQSIMSSHHPTLVRKTLDILQAHFAKIMLPDSQFLQWNLGERLASRWGPVEYNLPDPSLPLVEMKGKKYTVHDFLNWYRAREMNLKFNLSSPQLFFASLEGYAWRMVRDKLLTERAFSRKLQRVENVKKQLAWWKDKIVYNIVKAGITDSIRYSGEDLKKYYADHQKDFREKDGTIIPFEKAKDDVLRAWYAFETTRQTVHRVLKLKEQYHIVINDRVLDSLYVDTENNPRAIDVYIAKTGGIFPRPAFPTIDFDWQTWN